MSPYNQLDWTTSRIIHAKTQDVEVSSDDRVPDCKGCQALFADTTESEWGTISWDKESQSKEYSKVNFAGYLPFLSPAVFSRPASIMGSHYEQGSLRKTQADCAATCCPNSNVGFIQRGSCSLHGWSVLQYINYSPQFPLHSIWDWDTQIRLV